MNSLNNKNNILVKTDQNNLIYIDPNSVVYGNEVKPRNVPQEELVMYVNLEADLVPRTTMIMGNEKSQLSSIASGTFNMLHNNDGRDLNTSWTEAYVPNINQDIKFNDTSGQSFGIDNISIKITGTNFVPNVSIKFIDVRGKTLFDSPENSPYKAFFHLPWPIFYLTIKGFYGKAIRYRLHLTKFSSRYNSQNGNFEVDTIFVGSTYAYLNDIPLKGILNAPYMFAIENDEKTTFNESTGMYKKTIKKTSKGYQTLVSVYKEYINKGLIPKNFPVKTLRELVITAGRLEKILEKEIFDKVVNPSVLSGINEYKKTLLELEEFVDSWKKKHLSPEFITDTQFNKLADKNKNNFNDIVGINPGTLEYGLKLRIDKLYNNSAFGKKPFKDTNKFKNNNINNNLTTISLTSIENIDNFTTTVYGVVGVNILDLIEKIYDIQRIFEEKRKVIENSIEQEMNNIVRSGKIGQNNNSFGFDPTIRNIVAVILANADTYIRLMKGVHDSAFNVSNQRKSLIDTFETDAINGDNIYPWPEIKKQSADGKISVLTYPGAYDVVNKLKSFNSFLWPEVNFVENFLEVSTYNSDPLADKEINPEMIEYIFENSSDIVNNADINLFSTITSYLPYANKSFSSLVYEIYERSKYTMSFLPYDNATIKELATIESENLFRNIENDPDLFNVLKNKVTRNKYTGTTEPIIYNLFNTMAETSLYDRYPYYQSQLPTVEYIKNVIENDFLITTNSGSTKNYISYEKLENFITNYENYVEDYRLSIYPFNSPTYLEYIDKQSFTKNDLKFNGGILSVNNDDSSFISSIVDPTIWVKNGYDTNLFKNLISVDGGSINFLNTPYFHKQLYDDFKKTGSSGKYVGSSYLLLNSLPFIDLHDRIVFNNTETLASTLFREIGASHKIPYHLMLKWGSIYHRYKKYISDGIDIVNGVTQPINIEEYYDNTMTGRTYSGDTWSINLSDNKTLGFYPFYHDVFHQIVNDYSFFEYNTGTTLNYYNNVLSGGTKVMINKSYKTDIIGCTSYVDNSKYTSNNIYTILPSYGNKNILGLNYNLESQSSFRIIWGNEYDNVITPPEYSGYTFPEYNEYHISTGNTYTMMDNYKKVVDLIATFKSEILDVFEDAFLEFASERINTEMVIKTYDVNYYNFQNLLKDIVTVNKVDDDTDILDDNIISIIKKQNDKLIHVTNNILDDSNLVTIVLSNPREINDYVIGSFTEQSDIISDFGGYNSTDLNSETKNYIKLHLGEFIDTGTTGGLNYYERFFFENNIKLTLDNIKLFRPLIQVYAGAKIDNLINGDFKTYVKSKIIQMDTIYVTDKNNKSVPINKIEKRTKLFLNTLFNIINGKVIENNNQSLNIKRSYNDDIIKLELYNYFKSFNDKWTAGNSIGQRTLMEEFLFLDKSNKDIGDQVYIDITKLIPIIDTKNKDLNLYGLLVMLLQNTGFDIRPLPSYVNFYGTNFSNNPKITPSKDVAKNIFGTFLDVDHEESSPKIILQYFGPSSKHLELDDIDRKSRFKGDGFNISNTNGNPVIVSPDVFRNTDFTKSNRAVAFEVSIGDQQQSMFKTIDLEQATIKNTTESYYVIENLGKSSAGSSTSQIDIGLFDIYRQASYQCTVNGMGNVMIQPTMYFYLKNVPMFRGTYWITEVIHTIRTTGIDTTFKGSRIPVTSLPDPKDSFMASYRTMFDKMVRSSLAKVKAESEMVNSEKAILTDTGTYYYDLSGITINGENIIERAGIKPYGIPYNGFKGEKYIQLVNYTDSKNSLNNGEWLRTFVIRMGSSGYTLDDNVVMSIASGLYGNEKILWGDIKNNGQKYYSSKFYIKPDMLINNFTRTIFLNPKNGKKEILSTNINQVSSKYEGPINVGPGVIGYGMGLSLSLMNSLGLKDGDILYFRIE